jgi:23S rRNA (uracil1939-C5)-methyltransferase
MDSEPLKVKLDKFAYGGDAIGRLADPSGRTPGRTVFVSFTLPGEEVIARLLDKKHGRLRFELVDLLQPSPDRISPRCRHFGTCGGCAYQHMSYANQLRAKTSIMRDQLSRLGKIHNPPLQDIVPSTREWNYRNNIQFHLSSHGELGFVGADGHSFVPISECHLPEVSLNAVWPKLEIENDLSFDRITLRCGDDGQSMLVLESRNPDPPELQLEASLSVIHLTADDAIVLAGDGAITISVKERPFRVSAGSFFQVNTPMAAKMVDHLIAQLPVTSSTSILDVYCGVGLFSAFFAEKCASITGVELSPSACNDYAFNLDEFENVALFQAPAAIALPELKISPDIVILDPPRAGLEKNVLSALLSLSPAHIAYVSCDPSTLSRDLARLIAEGYRLTRVTPFDLFPQTYSIESISILEKG